MLLFLYVKLLIWMLLFLYVHDAVDPDAVALECDAVDRGAVQWSRAQ